MRWGQAGLDRFCAGLSARNPQLHARAVDGHEQEYEKMKTRSRAETRTATADLFQLNFRRNLSQSRFLHEQLRIPINQVTDRAGHASLQHIEGPIFSDPWLLLSGRYSMQISGVPWIRFHTMCDYYLQQLSHEPMEPHTPSLVTRREFSRHRTCSRLKQWRVRN